jgi:lipopolysaccharide export system permease protein
MKILNRYILREHIGPFTASFVIITFLFGINFLLEILDSVLSKGLPMFVLLEIFFLSLAWMLALSIPMACLVASLMAFGRLSADHEITAIKASGIAPLQVIRPIFSIAALITMFLVVFNNWILPEANHRAGSLIQSISRKKPQAFVAAGRLITDFPDVQIWIDHIDPNTGVLYGIRLFEIVRKGPPILTWAKEGTMEYTDMGRRLKLHLNDGTHHRRGEKDKETYFRIDFKNQVYSLRNVDDRFERKERSYRGDRELPIQDMLKIVEESKKNKDRIFADKTTEIFRHMEYMNTLINTLEMDSLKAEALASSNFLEKKKLSMSSIRRLIIEEKSQLKNMLDARDRIKNETNKINKYLVEIHKKFSIPMACIIFVLIGAPLGIMARKGGLGTGVVYSILFFVIYWIFLKGGETLADKGFLDPWFAMWASNIVIGIVGIRTLVIMSKDNYSGHSKFKTLLRKTKRVFRKKPKAKEVQS